MRNDNRKTVFHSWSHTHERPVPDSGRRFVYSLVLSLSPFDLAQGDPEALEGSKDEPPLLVVRQAHHERECIAISHAPDYSLVFSFLSLMRCWYSASSM
jgi:hypothetical protein